MSTAREHYILRMTRLGNELRVTKQNYREITIDPRYCERCLQAKLKDVTLSHLRRVARKLNQLASDMERGVTDIREEK